MYENVTVLTKKLCFMFNFTNLIDKRKFNLFTLPSILLIISSYFAIKNNTISMLVISFLLLAMIIPLTITVINYILVGINYSKYAKYKKIYYTFDTKGIRITNQENEKSEPTLSEKILIRWDKVKQIDQYRKFYIVNFEKGEAMVLSRNGFIDNCEREFCSFIEDKVKIKRR